MTDARYALALLEQATAELRESIEDAAPVADEGAPFVEAPAAVWLDLADKPAPVRGVYFGATDEHEDALACVRVEGERIVRMLHPSRVLVCPPVKLDAAEPVSVEVVSRVHEHAPGEDCSPACAESERVHPAEAGE